MRVNTRSTSHRQADTGPPPNQPSLQHEEATINPIHDNGHTGEDQPSPPQEEEPVNSVPNNGYLADDQSDTESSAPRNPRQNDVRQGHQEGIPETFPIEHPEIRRLQVTLGSLLRSIETTEHRTSLHMQRLEERLRQRDSASRDSTTKDSATKESDTRESTSSRRDQDNRNRERARDGGTAYDWYGKTRSENGRDNSPRYQGGRPPRHPPSGAPRRRYVGEENDSPFSEDVFNALYPDDFDLADLTKYDGTQDPTTHVEGFQVTMCLAKAFELHFATSKQQSKSQYILDRIKQRQGETLQSYLDQFRDTALQVRGLNEKVHVYLLAAGLDSKSRLAESFFKELAKTLNEFITRSKKYLKMEQMRLANSPRKDPNRRTPPRDKNQSDGRKQDRSGRGSDNKSPSTKPEVKGRGTQPSGQPGNHGNPSQLRVKRIFIDTGSSADIIIWDAFKRMNLDKEDLKPCKTTLVGFNRELSPPKGYIDLRLILGTKEGFKTDRVRFIVAEFPSPYNVILGRPTIHKWDMLVLTKHQKLKMVSNANQVLTIKGDQKESRQCYFETIREGKKAEPSPSQPRDIQPKPEGELEDLIVGIRLEEFLAINRDVFAWSLAEIPEINPVFCCHRLAIRPGSAPVDQKKRKRGPDRQLALDQHVDELLEAGFIREIQYTTWLSNVVMVLKPNGKWRVCTNYTNLNKACPKDAYPMPNIDQLVDNSSEFQLLSFMDAYSGYNQIAMHPDDQEATTFISEKGNYYYNVMPFSLKNAGAMY
ncbi:hypothetical protein K1719_024080 [Acacia pycnantha]|nr:hypothetical protein K1719_024080 [Acacia pycnantha]